MPTIIGNRHGKKSRHKTVTEAAKNVYSELLRNKFISHPGVISPSHSGTVRITLTYESTRTRVAVSGKGSQELLLYGPVDHEKLEKVLSVCTSFLTVRDQSKRQ